VISPQKLDLYRRLAEVAILEVPGGRALASIHPLRPGIGALAVEGGVAAIRAGEAWLRVRGCTRVQGPMEVSTWFPYRARLGPDAEPGFFGEPEAEPGAWLEAGYREVARYASTLVQNDVAIARGEEKRPAGVRVRQMHDSDEVVELVYRISHEAFARAFAFTPLPRTAFDALYRPMAQALDPRLVLIAEREGEPVGFVLGLLHRAGRLIVKTLAVRPGVQSAGVGTWLVGELHRTAAALGCREGVHALMWSGSHSRRICPSGEVIREYALFERELSR
jgi:GNAT superfamily N-acetyltransferase